MTVRGGCVCGAVRYVLSRNSLPPVICCHCRDCQTRSGSAFDQTAFVDVSEIEITGPLVTIETKSLPSGADLTDNVCGRCRTMIYNIYPAKPELVLLRACTLDDSHSIVPIVHAFTSRKQSWVKLSDDVFQCEAAATPEALKFAGAPVSPSTAGEGLPNACAGSYRQLRSILGKCNPSLI